MAGTKLILTTARGPEGDAAINDILEGGSATPFERDDEDLSFHYVESFDQKLANGETDKAFEAALEQPFAYHLIKTPSCHASFASKRLQWRYGGRGDRPGKILRVEPNHLLRISQPAISMPVTFNAMHTQYKQMIGSLNAHVAGELGRGRSIAVVDTGLDPSLIGIASGFWDATTNPIAIGLNALVDDSGHGSAMAMIAASVARCAEIFPVRVAVARDGDIWSVMLGVALAAAECEADIISLSLGFPEIYGCPCCGADAKAISRTFEGFLDGIANRIRPATGRAPVIVAASGNVDFNNLPTASGAQDGFEYPAAYDGVLAVGAVDSTGARGEFSRYDGTASKRLHLVAPGGQANNTGVLEDVGQGQNAGSIYGTSIATAYAAGTLAVLWADPRYSALDQDSFIRAALQLHCRRAVAQDRYQYGAGFLQWLP